MIDAGIILREDLTVKMIKQESIIKIQRHFDTKINGIYIKGTHLDSKRIPELLEEAKNHARYVVIELDLHAPVCCFEKYQLLCLNYRKHQ